MEYIKLTTPLKKEDVINLKTGDKVLLSGVIYTARDAAHKKFIDALGRGESLPFDIEGSVIYYVGPTPTKVDDNGNNIGVIGSAGPTTSYRMDSYAPKLIELGMRGMIGKGKRNNDVVSSCAKYGSVYFGATGGAGALISKTVKSSKIIAFEELGAEAVRELIVEDFPLIVINDTKENDLYEEGKRKWQK